MGETDAEQFINVLQCLLSRGIAGAISYQGDYRLFLLIARVSYLIILIYFH